jgi:hypothetical protein
MVSYGTGNPSFVATYHPFFKCVVGSLLANKITNPGSCRVPELLVSQVILVELATSPLGGKGFVPRPFPEDNQFSSPWIHITSNVFGFPICVL